MTNDELPDDLRLDIPKSLEFYCYECQEQIVGRALLRHTNENGFYTVCLLHLDCNNPEDQK